MFCVLVCVVMFLRVSIMQVSRLPGVACVCVAYLCSIIGCVFVCCCVVVVLMLCVFNMYIYIGSS